MADLRKEIVEVRGYEMALSGMELSDTLVQGMNNYIKHQEKAFGLLKKMVNKGLNKGYAEVFDKVDEQSAWWTEKRKVAKHLESTTRPKKPTKKQAEASPTTVSNPCATSASAHCASDWSLFVV